MSGAVVAAGSRGRVRIADRVYTAIAARAAQEALAPAWAPHGRRGPLPKVTVLVTRNAVRLTLHLELPFPADIAALATTARNAVTTEVTALTGTPVSDLNVTIDRLHPAGPRR
ncbi:hypothetical protein ACGFX4_22280 [Kitasatospora sp. NPDC048365]|uniref:hypothetical protein n=1 Tax=Kitasatospora sp. NPDC048365 TaxID=3364050 RepID=UPI0037231D63